ncbi:MAG TPA: lytic murein transglycosylase [Phenylobacterium sp.]|uniref:lytic murein transglycosylase n=1 Tax=Phenylobacterium sp. TaxID=1871053 RepID=UPI002B4A9670|nr:lytic murein transglycosylase [Phenylobacterium sp.]HKR87212.1 lytic murein transglycosylase [Phenylobacterium sp.]
MRHRYLLLFLALAGCASPANRGPQPRPAYPETATAPSPSSPQSSGPVRPLVASGDMQFDAWAAGFYGRAVAAGISPELLAREFAGLTPDPRVGGLDNKQPEFSKPLSDYIRGVVTDTRVAIGAQKSAQVPQLPAIEQRYGVPRGVLEGIWGMESGFGAIQGNFDVIRAMATLAAQGRRREFAEDQLIAALELIGSGEVTRSQLRGSWAGAMGQTQFIPSTFVSTAVDGDGDGKRDIWGDPADALASAANLLRKGGWVPGQDWAREVSVPPGFDFSLTEGPKKTPIEWGALGVRRADGQYWPAADQTAAAQLVAPTGAAGPIFLLFPNHFAIRKYNNSLAYALGVGLLADRFEGRPGLARPWPQEAPLSLVDRMIAQRALASLGFDPGAADGLVGLKTRDALRAWQKARGLVADGYLSPEMIRRLKAEAGVA